MTNTAQHVRDLAAEEFQVSANEVQPTSGPEDIKGWDSTAHMRLMARIEEAFSVSLDLEEIVEMEFQGGHTVRINHKRNAG